MQSLSTNHEPYRNSTFFVEKELFTSVEVSVGLSCIDNNSRKEYGPIHEQSSKVESLAKQSIQMPSKSSNDKLINNLENLAEKPQAKIGSSNVIKKESFEVVHDGGPTRTIRCTFFKPKQVGDIISTSRSGHLIEKKDENCFSLSESVNENEDCDSNDNIIKQIEKPFDGSHDINDNPDEKNVFQKEETTISDNGKPENSDCETPCSIGLVERLIRSHPVWFLPGIQRAGAVHLLQGKEEGNFIVRQSSQPDTMAVSVRLPVGKGPYIEHYLIQAVGGQLSLESSENLFQSIPSLIAHYCQCCDELPVQLTLPRTIREAKNRQQLSSLALLGQEFWRYPMANPRPTESNNSSPNSNISDSMSSFEGIKKIINQNNEIILDLVPLHQDLQFSSFKNAESEKSSSLGNETKPKRPLTLDLVSTKSENSSLLLGNKTPPQPPPRWTKPSNLSFQHSPIGHSSEITESSNNQIEFIQEKVKEEISQNSQFLSSTYPAVNSNLPISFYDRKVSSPQSDQTDLRSFALEREANSLRHFQEKKKPQVISPMSDTTGFVSRTFGKAFVPQTPASTPTENFERSLKKSKKESTHYQECDILESPSLHYYKSNIADKQSDYEDIWGTESFTTFKPFIQSEMKKNEKNAPKKPPDLLEKLELAPKSDKKPDKVSNLQNDFASSEVDADGAQNSPFYTEPVDALVVRRKAKLTLNKSRHSDPFSFQNWCTNANPYFSGGCVLDRIDSQNEMSEEINWKGKPSLSFDNIVSLKKNEEGKSKAVGKSKNAIKAKPVRPPKVSSGALDKHQQCWAVDSSWEFIGNEETEKETEMRFPSIEQQMDSEATSCKCTVQEMITQRFPHFRISKYHSSFESNNSSTDNSSYHHHMPFRKSETNKTESRISAYDNLTNERCNVFPQAGESEKNSDADFGSAKNVGDELKSQMFSDSLRLKKRKDCGSVTEENEDAQTIFSEPWDSRRWENLLPSEAVAAEDRFPSTPPAEDLALLEKPLYKNAKEELNFALTFSGLGKDQPNAGASIRSYALHLASDKSTTFAQNIDNFIECTLESKEVSPQVVMRNMRQFMSGMKNYLVKHGEREFEKQVEKERMKLKSTEFLNLDAILESVMHKLVVRPLKEHLYKLFVDEYIRTGAIQLMYENLSYAKAKSLHHLGLKTKIMPPSQEALEIICRIIMKLQEVDSPLEKLDHLLACVSTMMFSVKSSKKEKASTPLGADDILPLFVWVLVQSEFIAAEIEAEYMWGLLHPSLLSGEGCYYLTTLSSAVHVLKNLKFCDPDQPNKSAVNDLNCEDFNFVLKIIVPDELHGSILTKTLPVKPNMTTKDVCKIIAHKIRITNPQDFGLFRLVDGEETQLNDNECPQNVKNKFLEAGKHCTLAYKRIDAKIGWPRTA